MNHRWKRLLAVLCIGALLLQGSVVGFAAEDQSDRFRIITEDTAQDSADEPVAKNPRKAAADVQSAAQIVSKAGAWLRTQKNADGSFGDNRLINDTCDVVAALGTADGDTAAWLNTQPNLNNDMLARRIWAGTGVSKDKLLANANDDGGFGLTAAYSSEPFDTALALLALSDQNRTETQKAFLWLANAQNRDGGWGYTNNGTSDRALTAFIAWKTAAFLRDNALSASLLEACITKAENYLGAWNSADLTQGKMEESLFRYMLAGIREALQSHDALIQALGMLQAGNGSFFDDVHLTALTLYLLQRLPDIVDSQLRVNSFSVGVTPGVIGLNTETAVVISIALDYVAPQNQSSSILFELIEENNVIWSNDQFAMTLNKNTTHLAGDVFTLQIAPMPYDTEWTIKAHLIVEGTEIASASTTLKVGNPLSQYTVTYNANGATSGTAPETQTKNKGVDLTLRTNTGNLARTGYTLDGWSTSASGAKAYNLGGVYSADASVTLYAHWKANTYAVKFNGNGATSGSMSNQEFTYDAAQDLTANAFGRAYTVTYNYNGATGGKSASSASANSTFNGWATSANGAKVYGDRQSVKNLATGGTFNLYANWTPGTVTLPAPTKTGSRFSGWYTDAALTVYAGGAGEAFEPGENMTLYAGWVPVALVSVAVNTMPTKTTYLVNESFDQSGLTLTATYEDNSTQIITNGFTCSRLDSSRPGEKEITVTYQGKTTTFSVTVEDPVYYVEIQNWVASRTVDYRTTVTFFAVKKNQVAGATVHWFIDGKDVATGDSYTKKEAKQKYTVQIKYIKDEAVLAESKMETVEVKNGFFSRLIAFFRALFRKLPVLTQEYYDDSLREYRQQNKFYPQIIN